MIETTKLFEYKRQNRSYWDELKFYIKVVNKALWITKALYFSYSLLFLFNNVTSHAAYADSALRQVQITTGFGKK